MTTIQSKENFKSEETTMLKHSNRAIALGTLGVMSLTTLGGTLAVTSPAQADSKTWKKAAIGAAAVTGYGLLKGKGKVATIGGAATAGSYYMYCRQQRDGGRRRRGWGGRR